MSFHTSSPEATRLLDASSGLPPAQRVPVPVSWKRIALAELLGTFTLMLFG